MRIEPHEIQKALALSDYATSRVIVIISAPDKNVLECLCPPPLEAIKLIDRVAALGEQVDSDPPERWGYMIADIMVAGRTPVIKFQFGADDHYRIRLEGFDRDHLRRLQAISTLLS